MRHNNDNKYDTQQIEIASLYDNTMNWKLSLAAAADVLCLCYEKCEKCGPRPYKSI